MENTLQTSAQGHMPNRKAIEAAIDENRGWFTALGVVLVLIGIAAIVFPLAGALAIDFVIATAFIVTGIVYFAHAFGTRSWGGLAWQFIVGLVYLAAGIILFVKPVEGVAVLTAVIALSLIADGIVRTAVSIAMRRGTWGWVLASGILSVVLGIAVFAMSAGNAVLLIGLLVGINMFASGMAFLLVAMAVRDELHEEKAA